jgi:hypothetical protein
MHGSTGGSWRRSTLIMATGVAQPAGKPAEHRPRDLPVSRGHRASSRPNQPPAAPCFAYIKLDGLPAFVISLGLSSRLIL